MFGRKVYKREVVRPFASKPLSYAEHTGDFRNHKMMKGSAFKAGPQIDTREPISSGILKGLWGTWEVVCLSPYKNRVFFFFHEVALVAFFGGGGTVF